MLIYDLSIEEDDCVNGLFCLYDNNENEIFEGGFNSRQDAEDKLKLYIEENL
jgi:hypothetical protein